MVKSFVVVIVAMIALIAATITAAMTAGVVMFISLNMVAMLLVQALCVMVSFAQCLSYIAMRLRQKLLML